MSIFRRRLALVFPLLLATLPAFAQEKVTPERLRNDLEQGARLFRRSPDIPSAVAYARALDRVEVDLGQGRSVEVRDPWLADAVDTLPALDAQARKSRLTAIAEHLALRASLVDAAPPAGHAGNPESAAPPDPDRVLSSILEESQYHPPAEDPKLAGAAARVRDSVRAWWHDLVQLLKDLVNGQPRRQSAWDSIKGLVELALALAGVVALFWIIARTIARAAGDVARSPTEEEALPEEPPVATVMEREAATLTSAGDLRGAVRALYLALLGRLHTQGAIVYDRHRTNREYLLAARLEGRKRGAFGEVIEVFDRTWYGRRPVSEKEIREFERATRTAAGEPEP